jgi:hypothetical protein
MFGGAGAGLATNDAQRVAKARKNYAAKGRRSALLIKEAELESHSLGGALADPTFKSAGHAVQASLRARAAALATKKENNERAKVSKNITARAIASVKKEAAEKKAANNAKAAAKAANNAKAAEEKKAANNAKAAEEKKAANNAKAADKAANNAKAAEEKKAANNAKAADKAANNAKKAVIAEKNARNALKKYLSETVKPRYNKALVNAILKLPDINNNTRRRLQAPRMYALQRGAGALGRGAVTAGGALGRGAVTAGGALGRGAVTAGGALGRGAVTAGGALGGFFSRSAAVPATGGGFFSRLFAPKPAPTFIPFKQGMKIPLGYVLKRNNKNKGLGYYKNNKGLALESQLEHRGYGPAPKPTGTTTGVSIGVGPSRYRNNYGYRNNYENRYGNNRRGPGAPSGGIVFAPKINVGAARIGAQTFGGTRVGGQTMGGSRATTGNVGGTRVTTGNGGRLAVSAPTTNGNRQLAATPEQLIRGAGGAEAVERGIKALNAANGNVTRAKAASRLPNNTFTNIYAMGGPVAAKRLVESRRRRRTAGRVGLRVASKKKRVAHKPRKQYIKLTPYQFRRLTDHIKKNNLRKVLIKEITH